jgi:geranylgeranyl pyrophosphate synthase
MEKSYTFKLEDKAAFLNLLEKIGVKVESSSIKDNIIQRTFTATFHNPEDIEKIKEILKQSSKIDQLKEYIKGLVKEILKENLEV